jgi:hypothetical protein
VPYQENPGSRTGDLVPARTGLTAPIWERRIDPFDSFESLWAEKSAIGPLGNPIPRLHQAIDRRDTQHVDNCQHGAAVAGSRRQVRLSAPANGAWAPGTQTIRTTERMVHLEVLIAEPLLQPVAAFVRHLPQLLV